ncbi:hypothetical protein Y032_0384g397 [Ancylostoma ceylanicum]|nr:hypothetical protein Y032_0384g397 [Ancylostoma ceylanicum]
MLREILKQKMPFLGKLFDKKRKRKQATPTAEEAINNLRDIEAILVKKQEYYEEKIAAEVATAKKHGTKNQKLALAALKRKKHHETELSRIDGVLMKIEAQRTALEDAGLNMEVIGVLDHTTAALRLANQNLDIDKVGELMDTIAEDLQLSDEFATAISQPIGDVHDEDELMKELEDLEKVELDCYSILSFDLKAAPTKIYDIRILTYFGGIGRAEHFLKGLTGQVNITANNTRVAEYMVYYLDASFKQQVFMKILDRDGYMVITRLSSNQSDSIWSTRNGHRTSHICLASKSQLKFVHFPCKIS